MTVTNVHHDLETLTLTLSAEFDAPVERVWQLWSDPRQLERWWGPPTYPATVVDHELIAGGRVTYFMTGPEGDRYHGWWQVLEVDPPRRLRFEDGFADEHGVPSAEMPTTIAVVTLSERDGGGTRMEIRSTFPSAEAMERLLAMGLVEGLTAAAGQMDDILQAEIAGSRADSE
jgi:uncharacterized protein YndB with AHSA1/START domain